MIEPEPPPLNAWDEMAHLMELLTSQPPEAALGSILEAGQSLLGADWLAVYLVHESGPPRCAHAFPSEPPAPPRLLARAVQRAGQTETPVTLPDGRLVIAAPIQSSSGNALAAALTPPACYEPARFRAFCGALAVALRTGMLQASLAQAQALGEKRLREVATLYEVGRAMEDKGIDRFLQVIVEKATSVMEAQACSVLLKNEAGDALVFGANCGLSAEVVQGAKIPLGRGIAGRVAATGVPMLINDPDTDPRLLGVPVEKRPEIVSSMCVPLRGDDGKTIGVLNIRRLHPAPSFNEDDLRLFGVFASQASLAFNNAQLYTHLSHRVHELSTLADLTSAIISPLDLRSLLEGIADRITEVVGFDRCAIFLLDRNRVLAPRIMRGYSAGVFPEGGFRLNHGLLGLVAKKLMPIAVHNAKEAIQPMKGFARMMGVNAFVAVPIPAKGRSIGVLVVDNRVSGRPISDPSIELLTTFANQAGMAIETGRLYEQREQRLAEIQGMASFLDNVLRSIGTGVVTVGLDGSVTTWNNAAATIFGVPVRKALGRPLTDLIADALPEEHQAAFFSRLAAPARAARTPLHLKFTDDRERDLVIVASPLRTRGGEQLGTVVLVDEVTAQQEMERKMQRMARLAEIGQLTATIAHELRNPMTSIKGAAQYLRTECDLPEITREFVQIILDETNVLSQIADEFLEFAKPMQLQLEPHDINEAIRRTVQFVTPYCAENNVKVVCDLQNDLPIISYDALRIGQSVRNLITNAVQAMPDGGKLRIATRLHRAKGQVQVEFRDTGVGIPPENLERIFSPFFTTKTKGTGLGLSIVQKIVDAHGGKLTVDTEPGVGTQFALWLPVERPKRTK